MTRTLGNRQEMTHDEWLRARSGSPDNPRIGSSDASAVLGVNPWKSEYQLWLEKTGELEPEDLSDNMAVRVGTEIEDVIARLAAEEMGWTIQNRHQVLQHEEHDWMTANVDREIIDHPDGVGVLEVKNTSVRLKDEWFGSEGSEIVPARTIVQVHHQCAVKGYDHAWVAALIGSHDLQIRRVPIDDELIERIEREEQAFVQSVIDREPPDVDGSDAAREHIMDRFPDLTSRDEPRKMEGEEAGEMAELIQRYDDAKEQKDEAEDELDAIKNRIMEVAGEDKKVAVDVRGETRKVTQVHRVYERFDSKQFEQDYPDLYEEYLQEPTESRYPRIY